LQLGLSYMTHGVPGYKYRLVELGEGYPTVLSAHGL
jgi:hypothetical protein